MIRHLIVRAAPTCTLWVRDEMWGGYHFRFNHRWAITDTEVMMHRFKVPR
jgi:hypothetical protein